MRGSTVTVPNPGCYEPAAQRRRSRFRTPRAWVTIMMRQNVEGLIERSFAILDGAIPGTPDPIVVQPTLEIVRTKPSISA